MRSKKGLTLIELLIVVHHSRRLGGDCDSEDHHQRLQCQKNACNTNVDTLNTSIEVYNNDKGAYPASLPSSRAM